MKKEQHDTQVRTRTKVHSVNELRTSMRHVLDSSPASSASASALRDILLEDWHLIAAAVVQAQVQQITAARLRIRRRFRGCSAVWCGWIRSERGGASYSSAPQRILNAYAARSEGSALKGLG